MKKMKKSKVIVPALGLLLLSTAASVSGTVAWFSANTTYNTSVGNIAVANLEGSLNCQLTAGVGTVLDTSAGTLVLADAVSDGNASILGDASFDHVGGHLYNDTAILNSYEDLGTESATTWKVSEDTANKKIYYRAVSWTMTFSFTFQGDTNPMNLYFDTESSLGTIGTNSGDAAKGETSKAFRLAFVPATATDRFVWAPLQTEANCHYVNATTMAETGNATINFGTSAAPINVYGANYATGELLASDTSNTLASVATSGNNSYVNYLGQFTTTANSFAVKCTAWFEGTDLNVVTGAALQSFVASLKFFAVKNVA